MSLLVANHRRHKGILRALLQQGRSDSRFCARADRHNEYVLGRIKAHLLSRPEPISSPDPARAVEMAFLFAVAAIREVVLFGESCGMTTPSDEELAAELTHAFLAYLRGETTVRTPARLNTETARPQSEKSNPIRSDRMMTHVTFRLIGGRSPFLSFRSNSTGPVRLLSRSTPARASQCLRRSWRSVWAFVSARRGPRLVPAVGYRSGLRA